MARRERLGDGRLVDHAATGDVQDDGAGLEPGDRVAADQPARRPGQGHVDGHDVGAVEHRLELDQLDAVVGGRLGGEVRVDAEDGHLHRPRPDRDGLADLAETDDAERPPAQLEPGELRALPFAPADRRVGRGDPAGDGVEQCQRVLGRRDRVAGRGIDDDDARAGRRLEVDVVDPDPGPPDDGQPRPRGDELGIDLDLAADDQGVVVGQDRAQLVTRQARPLVDLVTGSQELDALLARPARR